MQTLSLYEINAQITDLLDSAIDYDTGEILNEDALNEVSELEIKKLEKVRSVGLYYKNLELTSDAIKSEIDKLAAFKKTVDNRVASMKSYLSDQLEPGEKVEFPNLKISWAKSTSTEIDPTLDAETFVVSHPELVKHKTVFNFDKTAIKKFLQNNEIGLKGIRLNHKQNIRIK